MTRVESRPLSSGAAPEPGRRELAVILEDDAFVRQVMGRWLVAGGFEVREFADGADGLANLPEEAAVLCLDLGLGDMPGLHVLRHLQVRRPDLPVVVVTAQSEPSAVVELMRAGAYDYLTKPATSEGLLQVVKRAAERHRQLMSLQHPRIEAGNIVGGSAAILSLLHQLERVLDSDVSVYIQGESGTGKELVASAIHARGRRARGPFVAINCGAIAPTLLEAELFGHEKGAFTGALGVGRGCFERAHGGTLFLDEIGEMSPSAQVNLLRALQERRIRRVGGQTEIPVDVRVICATNRSLEAEVKAGRFREDLYFRLAVYPLRVPSLRERLDDIPALIGHFMAQLRADVGRDVRRVSADALSALVRHGWPGNVRELRNTIHRAMLATDSDEICLTHLPPELQTYELPALPAQPAGQPTLSEEAPVVPLRELERRAIAHALQKTRGNIALAAKLLQIGRATLYRRVQELNSAPEEG